MVRIYVIHKLKQGGSLDGNDYLDLVKGGNKVVLFATSEKYANINDNNIITMYKKDLLDFVYANKKVISNT